MYRRTPHATQPSAFPARRAHAAVSRTASRCCRAPRCSRRPSWCPFSSHRKRRWPAASPRRKRPAAPARAAAATSQTRRVARKRKRKRSTRTGGGTERAGASGGARGNKGVGVGAGVARTAMERVAGKGGLTGFGPAVVSTERGDRAAARRRRRHDADDAGGPHAIDGDW